MKIDKNNSAKRTYKYYRPFFWSLNVKSVATISEQILDGNHTGLSYDGPKPK